MVVPGRVLGTTNLITALWLRRWLYRDGHGWTLT
jgi:hypothetical protein